MNVIKILGNMPSETFFKEYWEKKPLFIKNALKNTQSFAEAEDLLELSYDQDFESRLVIQGKTEKDFSVEHGPFTPKKFKDLKDKKWTLIAHNLNLLAPEFFELEKSLQFLPNYLFDDVMATYGKEGSTVGAHIDNYNVFILQGQGKRKWQLQLNPNKDFIEGLDIKILQEFKSDIEYELEPGDLLYIPPHVAHYGVTLEESISYSLGLKSLDHDKILNHYSTWLLSEFNSDGFIELDYDSSISKSPFEADEKTFLKVKDYILSSFSDEEKMREWYLNFLTSPKAEIKDGETISPSEFKEHLKNGGLVLRDQYSRFVTKEKDDYVLFNMSSKDFKMSKEDAIYFVELFNQEVFEPLKINIKDLNEDRTFALLCMIEHGSLYLLEEGEDELED